MCSPPLQEYFARLLEERNLAPSMMKVQIVSDNAQLSKKSHESASSRRKSLLSVKKCRWDSSPTLTLRKQAIKEDFSSKSLGGQANAAWSRQRLLLQTDKWGASSNNMKTRSHASRITPPRRSVSVPEADDPSAVPPSAMRRSTSLNDAPMIPMRVSSFSSKNKTFSSINGVGMSNAASLMNGGRFG